MLHSKIHGHFRKRAAMSNGNMKEIIGSALRERVVATSLSKTRISDLTDLLGINRNTFYYHFANKFEVASWTFLRQLSDELENRLPSKQLITTRFPANAPSDCEFAFYTHVETGARTLDFEEFFHGLISCILADRHYFGKLFNAKEPEFTQWATALWARATEADIDFILSGRYMPAPTRHAMANMYGSMYVSLVIWCLKNPDEAKALLDTAVYPHWNVFHNALFSTIQEHPTSKSGASLPAAWGVLAR